jgi:hypothetical protein
VGYISSGSKTNDSKDLKDTKFRARVLGQTIRDFQSARFSLQFHSTTADVVTDSVSTLAAFSFRCMLHVVVHLIIATLHKTKLRQFVVCARCSQAFERACNSTAGGSLKQVAGNGLQSAHRGTAEQLMGAFRNLHLPRGRLADVVLSDAMGSKTLCVSLQGRPRWLEPQPISHSAVCWSRHARSS